MSVHAALRDYLGDYSEGLESDVEPPHIYKTTTRKNEEKGADSAHLTALVIVA